jgi:hypothetical protein
MAVLLCLEEFDRSLTEVKVEGNFGLQVLARKFIIIVIKRLMGDQ